MTRWHPFVDRIIEVNLPLGWKSLNLEHYDGTIDPDEHLDALLTQANLYTNDDAILCRFFPMSLKGSALMWYRGFPSRSINSFDTLVGRFSSQYATSHSINLWTNLVSSMFKSGTLIPRWHCILCCKPHDLENLLVVYGRSSQQHGWVIGASQGLHSDGRNVEILKRSLTGWTKAQERRK